MKTIYAKRTALLAAAVAAASFAGAASAYNFEVGDTTASVYGYAKLDMIYDVDAKLGNAVTQGSRANFIRKDGVDGQDGHADLHAKQSRLGFKTSTPMSGSTLNTTIEGDFYGSGNDTLRLRHAFGEWNGILAGQTWTNFGGFLGMTPTIDFGAQPGQANINRQAQLRYTTGGFSVAVEEPGSQGRLPAGGFTEDQITGGTVPVAINTQNRLPDLTMRFQESAGDVSYAASAVLRELRYDNAGPTAGTQNIPDSDSAFAWGVNLEASAKVTEGVTLRGSITHGDGIGGYLNISPAGPGYADENGLQTREATGGALGASIAAGPGNLNLAYGVATTDLEEGNTGQDRYDSVFVNYIWSPISNVSYGVEASYHRVEWNADEGEEDKGDALRLQGMVQYTF